jgi:hypothetical protein
MTGATDANNSAAIQAQSDLAAAYAASEEATELPCETTVGGNLAGLTLTPGVYCMGGAASITGTLTLNAAGDPNAVWIFQIASTLITAPGAVVALIGNANAANVLFLVGSSATLGTTTAFQGNIIAQASITVNTGASVLGRLIALTGAVTLNDNAVTVPVGALVLGGAGGAGGAAHLAGGPGGNAFPGSFGGGGGGGAGGGDDVEGGTGGVGGNSDTGFIAFIFIHQP